MPTGPGPLATPPLPPPLSQLLGICRFPTPFSSPGFLPPWPSASPPAGRSLRALDWALARLTPRQPPILQCWHLSDWLCPFSEIPPSASSSAHLFQDLLSI